MTNHRLLPLLLASLLSGALIGCAAPQAPAPPTSAPVSVAPSPSATAPAATAQPPTPSATDTPAPTATREPTLSPTVAPTDTPEPATETVEPTHTATAIPASPTPAPPAETSTAAAGEVGGSPAADAAESSHLFPLNASRFEISSSHHDYPAADIACPIGSEFLAVTDGVVDFVSREDKYAAGSKDPADRGGLSVAIIGDDGVRYYGSHLSEVSAGIDPGVRVVAGQVLGLTGESGNAKGVYPQLHFGISAPTTPDDWEVRRGQVWPQKYLRAWLRGENITPALP